jgi:hypothetical protein
MKIREAVNEIFIEGTLKEKTLETTTIDTKDGKSDVIRGELVISTSADSEHRVRVFANKLTKEKKENSVYKGLVTVMNEYVSVAEALKNGMSASDATNVRITKGKMGLNEYYTPNGELRSYVVFNTNFVNRVQGEVTPKAIFTIEMFFKSIIPEVKDSEETGRTIIEGIIPLFEGVIPITFVANEGEVSDYIAQNYEVGKTGKVWGDIVNKVVKEVQVERGFGKEREKTVTHITNELVITGGESEQYDEDDTTKSYTKEQIKAALNEREATLEEKKKNSSSGGSPKPNGMTGGTTTTKKNPINKNVNW